VTADVNPGLSDLRCAHCGAEVKRHPASGILIHRGDGVIAACDRDGDHSPVPDWRIALPLVCGLCGGSLAVDAGQLRHDTPPPDGHLPDPWARPAAGTADR